MKGIYSALLGVFDNNNVVNPDGVRSLVRHNIEHCHVDGLYVNGSTGENFLMTTEAKKTVFREAAMAANAQCAMIAHIGTPVLEDVLELADYVNSLHYDAVSAVTPFYYKFSATEIKDYYRVIAHHSKIPLIAYYIPLLSGVTLTLTDLLDILDIPNVAGIKFTSNDMFLLEQLRAAKPNKLIFSGFDEFLLSASVLGTDGAIGSTYNIMGHWAKKVYSCANTCDLVTARKVQHHMNTVIADLISSGLFSTIKEVAKLYGIQAGQCKAPMSATTSAQVETAKKIYDYILSVDKELV